MIQEDLVPSTTALREIIRKCRAVVDAVAQKACDPDQPITYQTASAVAAARLGASTAQMMGALARAADADTRQRALALKMDEALQRASSRRRPAERTVEKEKSYNPHYYQDDPSDYRNYTDDDSEEENLDFNSTPPKPEGQNLNFNSPDAAPEEQKGDFNTGPQMRQR